MTLRVLQVINSVSASCGGPTTAMWNLLDALSLAGIEAELVTTDDDGPTRRLDVPLGVPGAVRGHRVTFFARQSRFYTASAPLASWLVQHVRHYDLVDVHGLFSFAPVVAATLARARNVPYVIRPHGVLNRWGRQHRRPRLKRASLRLLEGSLLRDASLVLFTSDAEREEASELGIPCRAQVVPLGLERPPSGDGVDRDEQLRAVAEPGMTILFLARIAPIKNLDVLLDAFARVAPRFPDLRMTVAGDGPPDAVAALRERTRALGIAGRVDWPGFVQGAAKERALRSATVLVLPSASENFGLSVVEAMARGIPVVVSPGVALATAVARSGAGRVCEPAVPALAVCLDEMLANPDARAAMGAAGRRLFETEYSLVAMGRTLRNAYEAIVASREPRAVTG